MTQSSVKGIKPYALLFVLTVFGSSLCLAQNNIEWSKDTVSQADAIGGRSTFVNTVKGSGQKATERINLPVDKLKAVLDACALHGISEISAMIVTVRQGDLARYRRNHPESTASDNELKGSQLLVFKVPRSAFEGASGAKVNLTNSKTMISLLSLGLVRLENPFGITGGSGDLYFGFGTICPPPLSCD
jgi:hypothetical protein